MAGMSIPVLALQIMTIICCFVVRKSTDLPTIAATSIHRKHTTVLIYERYSDYIGSASIYTLYCRTFKNHEIKYNTFSSSCGGFLLCGIPLVLLVFYLGMYIFCTYE